MEVDNAYEEVRDKVRDFIHAKRSDEIVFTSGTTDSLNRIVFGYFGHYLKSGDEVLITKSEHASNVLPWFVLEKELGIKVNYIPLNDDKEVEIDSVKKVINGNTKVISVSYVTNVIGDVRPIKEIVKLADNKIENYLKENGESKTNAIAEYLNLSSARTRKILSEMKTIEAIGTNTNRKYRLKDNQK